MQSTQRIDLIGCPFDVIAFDEVVEAMRRAVLDGGRLQIAPGNLDMVAKARAEAEFAEDLRRADLVIADGQFITWAAHWLGTPLRKRVSGTELVWACARISAETGRAVALIGAAPGVADRAAIAMMQRYPGSEVFALPTPFPLDSVANTKLVQAIRERRAAIVLAALGAPRQERWIHQYLDACGANVGIGIGSAFDIICGDKPRAPVWMQKLSLEWLHRMLQEPSRLGRRYLRDDLPLVPIILREALRRRLR